MEVVSAVQRELIERIGQERFELWFGQSVQLDHSSEALVVKASGQFLVDRLRKQFLSELAVVSQKLGAGAVQFCVDETLRPSELQSPQTPRVDSIPGKSSPPESAGGSNDRVIQTTLPFRQANEASDDRVTKRRKFESLQSFIVGDTNRVAFTAACAVAARGGEASPFFLYGPSGSGKTHLLQAIWTHVRSNRRCSRVLYLTAEQFTTYFLEALRGGGLPSFRRKCREVDLLAIDDVHFFAGKRATITELQHTMDALNRQGKQLVLAADRPPVQLTKLGPEIVTRCASGMVCGLEPADYETRLEIARRKSAQLAIALPESVLTLVAQEIAGDVRQIQGALHRLEATSIALQQPMTAVFARSVLRDILRATQRVVQLSDIEKAVCETFGLESKSLRDGGKTRTVSQPRMLAMWLARKYTRAASGEISQFFGRRSHSTVISAEKKVETWMRDNRAIQIGHQDCSARDAVQRLEARIKTG